MNSFFQQGLSTQHSATYNEISQWEDVYLESQYDQHSSAIQSFSAGKNAKKGHSGQCQTL